jgi:regulatory protein
MKSNLQKLEEKLDVIEAGAPSKQTISLLGRAIRYLSYRDHSETELIKKLRPHAESEDELSLTLKKLKEKNYLSNERFADGLISRKSKTLGVNRLVQEMRQHQLGSQIIEKHVSELKVSESERAFLIWEKKFGVLASEPKELARQIRFLTSRGFDQEIVYRIVKGKSRT